jgi:acetyl esterase/lipase
LQFEPPHGFYNHEILVSITADENTPPAYITHAGDDKVVDVDNSIVYYEKLRHHNVPVNCIFIPKATMDLFYFSLLKNGCYLYLSG